jgi:hypothetical protein
MVQSLYDFVSAAAQDLLKRQPPSGADLTDTDLEKKKKAALAQTGDNAVLQGAPPTVFNAAASSLMNRNGNQF